MAIEISIFYRFNWFDEDSKLFNQQKRDVANRLNIWKLITQRAELVIVTT